jgi:hypothetical protein
MWQSRKISKILRIFCYGLLFQIRLTHKSIFSNCDNAVIRFLQEFQRNSLLTNVNLNLISSICNPERFPQFMTNLWPLFTHIKAIKFDSATLEAIQCEHFELAKPLLASARILHAELVVSFH